MKEKQYENVDKDLALDAKEEESTEVELDVKKEVDKVVEVINNLRDTALKMRGAEVKMKEWSFLVSYTEEEYIVDFKMKLSVIPEKM